MKKTQLILLLRQRLPITNWLVTYSFKDAIGDLVAGLTVGLTLIPQAIAYAGLAGLGPHYGLYSAFAGSFVYTFFGTCKEVNIGPTALISLLTYTYTRGVTEYAILLCFLSGCVTTILGISQLGFLIDFISIPVVGGFTSAASVIIACSQIKGLLGLSFQSENFIETWKKLPQHIQETRIPDLLLSCFCISVIFTLKKAKDVKTSSKLVNKVFWFMGTARNAIVVVVCATASYFFECQHYTFFVLTGHVDAGLPSVKPPPFHNNFSNKSVKFFDVCKTLGPGVFVISLVSIIGNVAIAKAFVHGKILDATQEMLALGLCNIIGSFFQSMPVAGSFSRSAVNDASGVRTPFGGFCTSMIVVLALSLLTPYFYYIPRATLSSVLVCAVVFLIEINMVKSIWRCNKRDLIPAFTTFLSCLLLGVEIGILIGIAIDLAFLVYFHARPIIYVEHKHTGSVPYIIIRPSTGLLFPTTDYVRTYVTKCLYVNSKKFNSLATYIILDCQNIDKIDFTAIKGIHSVIKDLSSMNCSLVLMNARSDIVKCIKSFSIEPVLSIRSEVELTTVLKNIDTCPSIPTPNASLEISSTKL